MNAVIAAAQQIIKELEEELAQLPQQQQQLQHQHRQATCDAGQGQPALDQPVGQNARLSTAVRGLKEGLAAMEREMRDWEEQELEQEMEREEQERRRREEWRDAQEWYRR